MSFTLKVPLKVEDLKVVDEAQSDHEFLGLRVENVLGVRLELLDSLVVLGDNQKKRVVHQVFRLKELGVCLHLR